MLELHANASDPERRTLTASSPKPELRVLLAAPRGFCAGVRRAIDAVRDALRKHGAPVYVRRAIVHNLEVVRTLEAQGAIFVEELDEVPPGAVVIFSAHGIAPTIKSDARRRRLTAYDAVCPLVAKVHREVERHQENGRQIVLIGHAGHPEIEGTLGHVKTVQARVVRTVEEVDELPFGRSEPVAYAIQTTYSVDEAQEIVEALRERFSDLAAPPSSDICYATTNRQAAVREMAVQSDSVIVVGEHFSSNACRLAEVARALCDRVQLAADASQIDWTELPRSGVVGITAAASTPETSVQGVLAALGKRYSLKLDEIVATIEPTEFKRVVIV